MRHIDQLEGTPFYCFQNVLVKAGGIISEEKEINESKSNDELQVPMIKSVCKDVWILSIPWRNVKTAFKDLL